MGTFEQITFKSEGRSRRIILRDVVANGLLLTGIEVVNEPGGCGWHDLAPAGADERQWLLDVTLITRRRPMVEDLKYGGLVYAPEND